MEKKLIFNHNDKDVIVAGHRGIRAKFPENTMLSFKKAIEIGCDQLEIDINMTKDRKLMIMHDVTVETTTDGKGKIRDLTWNQIKELDAGFYNGGEFRGTKVPLLGELLEYLNAEHPEITLNVEIKDRTFECVDATIKMLFDCGFKDKFVITCWDANITQYAYEKFGVMTQGFPKSIFENYSNETYEYIYAIGIPMKILTKELVAEYNKLNIQPWAWCPDDEESVRYCIECGIRLVTCNDPEPALKVLKELGLHT